MKNLDYCLDELTVSSVVDGPTIQAASLEALEQGACLATAFASVQEARNAGLTAAVGCSNPASFALFVS